LLGGEEAAHDGIRIGLLLWPHEGSGMLVMKGSRYNSEGHSKGGKWGGDAGETIHGGDDDNDGSRGHLT
jgi:hypothetical protein